MWWWRCGGRSGLVVVRGAEVFFFMCVTLTFRVQSTRFERHLLTPVSWGVKRCRKVSKGVERCLGGNFVVSQKKLTPTFYVKLLFTR